MIVSAESLDVVSIDVEETQKDAVQDFFRQKVVKTMCPIKRTDQEFNGIGPMVQMKLVNQYTAKQIEEMKTIFWIGYNSARIEIGE